MGYDEEEVQVYQVDFLATKEYANLETYNLMPATRTKLDRMKKNRHMRHLNYLKAIKEAEFRINR